MISVSNHEIDYFLLNSVVYNYQMLIARVMEEKIDQSLDYMILCAVLLGPTMLFAYHFVIDIVNEMLKQAPMKK